MREVLGPAKFLFNSFVKPDYLSGSISVVRFSNILWGVDRINCTLLRAASKTNSEPMDRSNSKRNPGIPYNRILLVSQSEDALPDKQTAKTYRNAGIH